MERNLILVFISSVVGAGMVTSLAVFGNFRPLADWTLFRLAGLSVGAGGMITVFFMLYRDVIQKIQEQR